MYSKRGRERDTYIHEYISAYIHSYICIYIYILALKKFKG